MMCVTFASVYKVGKDLLLDASLQITWRGGGKRRLPLGQVAFNTYIMSKLATSFRLESALLPEGRTSRSRVLCYAGILRSADL